MSRPSSSQSAPGAPAASGEASSDAPALALEGLTLESILERLRVVVERLEGGQLALEESLKAFEEGVRLSRAGQKRLDEAERRVEVLLDADASSGAERTEPLGSPEE